jgi:hypothetical protein
MPPDYDEGRGEGEGVVVVVRQIQAGYDDCASPGHLLICLSFGRLIDRNLVAGNGMSTTHIETFMSCSEPSGPQQSYHGTWLVIF